MTASPDPTSPTQTSPHSAQDDGALHCLGNGRLCVYEQGLNIVQVFGPPYSAPSLGQMRLAAGQGLRVDSQHEPGCPVWRHRLTNGNQVAGEIVDFVASRLACLVRRLNLTQSLTFDLSLDLPARLTNNEVTGAAGGWLFEVPAGVYFFHEYPTPLPAFYQLAWKPLAGQGAVTVTRMEAGLRLVFPPGESTLVLSGGPAYPQALVTVEAALNMGFETLLNNTRQDWRVASRLPPDRLPPDLPPEVLQAVEDTVLLIETQQALEGGVLAGHNYHWAGMRDQYGVSRGLLALGRFTEARRILEFYWDIWQRHERLHNGMGIGVDAFHVHENDFVEITGYLVIQAFDLLEANPEQADFIHTIFPMLNWAFWGQTGDLAAGMLPFNGDETYVAGGILPRSALNDGSAEATLLFLQGGEKFFALASRLGRWNPEELVQARQALDSARRGYRQNFVSGGQLWANQPERTRLAHLPRFRHGVCERCLVEPSRPIGAIWTERSATGRYLCPDCLAKGDFPAAEPRRYQLNAVSLVATYFHSDLLSSQEQAAIAADAIRLYQQTGRLPSRPDEPDGLAVGYDYGLLLYALAAHQHPAAAEFSRAVLDLRDSAGAWAEYYRNGQPVGTRCRPWESAINLEAILKWARKGTS